MKRREFVKLAGIAAAGPGVVPGFGRQDTGRRDLSPLEKGIHPVLEEDHPYIFIDSCMQIW
ncbi:MAG: hypothetical protein WBB73_15540, partial [Candidatus Aminicenantaceae bacterium]